MTDVLLDALFVSETLHLSNRLLVALLSPAPPVVSGIPSKKPLARLQQPLLQEPLSEFAAVVVVAS